MDKSEVGNEEIYTQGYKVCDALTPLSTADV